MAQITAAMVKELREMTGAGMMDCKKALAETDGDKQKAIDYLREKGIAKAEKKAGRIAAEGAVGAFVSEDAKVGAVVEVNCETDFVAKTDKFHALVDKIAKHIADTNPADMDALNESTLGGKKVSEIVLEAIAEIGEKVSLRRFARYASEGGRVTSYIHMGGKIGVLVELTGGSAELGKDIAMQIAAANPSCVDRSGLDPPESIRVKKLLSLPVHGPAVLHPHMHEGFFMSQVDVFRHCQSGQRAHFLHDDGNACVVRIHLVADMKLFPVQSERASANGIDAAKHLAERALARAVLPDQSADLACSDLKGYIVDRVGDAEALINVFSHQ